LSGIRTVDLDVVACRNDVGRRLDCLAVGGEGVARGGGDPEVSGGISSQLISMSAAADSSQQYLSGVASFCCFLDSTDVLVDWRIGSRTGLYLLVGGSLSSAAVDKDGASVAAVAGTERIAGGSAAAVDGAWSSTVAVNVSVAVFCSLMNVACGLSPPPMEAPGTVEHCGAYSRFHRYPSSR
jgi:hypothetical protein